MTTPATYEEYIVTFLDILGFRNIINTRDAEEVDKIIKLTRYFAGDEKGERLVARVSGEHPRQGQVPIQD
jgi:hypothetical protein